MMHKSCLRYNGSKWWMQTNHHLSEYIMKASHDHPYCELFFGSGVLFFNLWHPTIHAFLNDINGQLINFWNIIRTRRAEFEDAIKYVWCAANNQDWFPNWEADPLERACVFYLNNRLNQHITKPTILEKDLSWWANRLDQSRVFIDCKPFEEEMDYLMKLYTHNDPERLCDIIFYEDPPYFGSEYVYGKKFKVNDLETEIPPFKHCLLLKKNWEAREKGHNLYISYNKCPEVLEMYPPEEGWYIKEFPYSPNGVAPGRSTERTELLISNHPIIQRTNQRKLM